MFIAAIAVLLISMLLILVRAALGPTVFDRMLAANLFTTNIILLIVVVAFALDEKNYIDIALVYAFLNFIATIGLLRYFKYGSFKQR